MADRLDVLFQKEASFLQQQYSQSCKALHDVAVLLSSANKVSACRRTTIEEGRTLFFHLWLLSLRLSCPFAHV